MLRRAAGATTVSALVLVASVVAGCGQGESEKKSDRGGSASPGGSASAGSGSGSGSAKASSEEFQGVIDSYGTAQAEIDAEGGEQEIGDYRVGYIVEPAEPWWEGDPGNLTLREPASGETNHIEILPFEARTGLLIPYMEGTLTVLDEAGEEVDSKPLQFYRGEFYHYANNFSLPQSGPYALRAEMQPPTFLRHETEVREGRVLTEPISVEFKNVEIDTEGE
jgi:Fe2+ transport protein